MLNRFKNAIYGSSVASEDITSVRIEYEYNEAILPRRIRSTLFRSPSFRDDILRDSNKSQPSKNNDNKYHHSDDIDLGKNRLIRRSATQERLDHGHTNHHQQSYHNSDELRHNNLNSKATTKAPKFRYSRPEFLQLKTEDEILVSADHQIRPIILPRDVYSLPWRSGYAECINAGKSLRNEDQAVFYQDIAVKRISTIEEMDESSPNLDSIPMQSQLPWVYFGIFDGHAGTAVAVAAAAQLHNIIGEKLHQVADLLIALKFDLDDDNDDDAEEYADCQLAATSADGAVDDGVGQKGEPHDVAATNQQATIATASEVVPTTPNLANDNDNNSNNMNNTTADNSEPDKLSKNNVTTTREEPSDQEVVTEVVADNSDHEKPPSSPPETPNTRPRAQHRHRTMLVSPERGLPKMIDICRNNITVDSLIIGALESAFWDMDALIAEDKRDYKMPGGCTAIVSLFILGKLYTCNAGDSRAIVYKSNQVIPMSFDFTPTSERKRILRLGQQRPEFLGNDFTHLEFIKRPTRKDLGKQMLFKDAYMTGWSMKTITYDDLKFPLVWGEGKRSRVLATIGVTRGFGDHELKAQYGSVHIKPFLTPEPEVRVLSLESDDSLSAEDVLIMGSDGLWDVTTNQEAADIVRRSFNLFSDNEETRAKYRYITAAQDLVIHSRGHTNNWNNAWRTGDDRFASLDDIAVFVIPLKQYKDEYAEWKRLRTQAIGRSIQQILRHLQPLAPTANSTCKIPPPASFEQTDETLPALASTHSSNDNDADHGSSSRLMADAPAKAAVVGEEKENDKKHNHRQHEPLISNEMVSGSSGASVDHEVNSDSKAANFNE